MKRYKLLKDIRQFPNLEIDKGAIGVYEEGYWRFQYNGMDSFEMGNALLVSNPEQYPEWFEEIKEERITASSLRERDLRNTHYEYTFATNKRMPVEKISVIRSAIEAILNDEPGPDIHPDTSNLRQIFSNCIALTRAQHGKVNYFAAAMEFAKEYHNRMLRHKERMTNKPTSSSIKGEVSKEWEILEYKNISNGNVRAGTEFLSVNRSILSEGGNDLYWKINSVLRKSDGVVFTVGDEVYRSTDAEKVKSVIGSFKIECQDEIVVKTQFFATGLHLIEKSIIFSDIVDKPVLISMREIATCITNYVFQGRSPEDSKSQTVIDSKKMEALFISKLKQPQ